MSLFGSSPFIIKMVGNVLCIFHLASGQYFLINATGATIWKDVLQGKSVETISASLAPNFPATSPQVVADDAAQFIEVLTQQTPLLTVGLEELESASAQLSLHDVRLPYIAPVLERLEDANLLAFSGPLTAPGLPG